MNWINLIHAAFSLETYFLLAYFHYNLSFMLLEREENLILHVEKWRVTFLPMNFSNTK